MTTDRAEATFSVVSQTIAGEAANLFQVETSCVGEYVVKKEEIKNCKFWVNAKPTKWGFGFTATLQTTWKINGTVQNPLNTTLEMK